MASLNSRAGVYERPTMSDLPEESHTTHLNAAQFTSVGIPVTTDGYEQERSSDEQKCRIGEAASTMRAQMRVG